MRLESDIKLDYKDVLIRPKRSTLSSRSEVDLERKFTFRNYQPADLEDLVNDYHYRGIPIMAANMDGVGTFEMAEALAEQGLFTCLVKNYSKHDIVAWLDNGKGRSINNNWAYSMGITQYDLDKLDTVMGITFEGDIKYVCIDVANGYSEKFVEVIKEVRQKYPHLVIIAGNVVTGEMTEELILSGADIVKVGIGPGSVCTTRIQTGVGYPQLSAVIECADAAHGLGGHIIADGGCTSPGDVAKALAGGADFVMLGGMLAGHDQGGGEVVSKWYNTGEYRHTGSPETFESYSPIIEEKKFVQFYGMSSKAANDKHFGGLKDYRASEGREVLVPYRGDVNATVQDILGGVRSSMTYCGARRLKDFAKCATFVRCTQTHNPVYEKNTIGN
jgi:GMP reductase